MFLVKKSLCSREISMLDCWRSKKFRADLEIANQKTADRHLGLLPQQARPKRPPDLRLADSG